MSDALPLPPRPDVEQYKKLAKDLQHVCKSDDPDAVRLWAARWVETLARLERREISTEAEAAWIERHWRKLRESVGERSDCTLASAQFFIARCHGFASWPRFVEHLEAAAQEHSSVSQFEIAVDAIVAGDDAGLKKLLRENPELVQARSTREHRSTLLHYVSANGIEDFRQKTPKNIVEIARMLLDAGAEVNAESEAYGGRSTALGLTATSCHPEAAGVQIALMDLLIDRGARIDGSAGSSTVNSCLHNGRGAAAEYLADRGARLDLEGAAGVGRLDLVRQFFGADGALEPSATREQMAYGFTWACEFGRDAVVEFLLQHGMSVGAELKHRATGLHWAALAGQAETVKLLLERGAPVGVADTTYGGTPLGWALHGWQNSADNKLARRSYETVALLVRAGARTDPSWIARNARLRSDEKMLAALRGEMPE